MPAASTESSLHFPIPKVQAAFYAVEVVSQQPSAPVSVGCALNRVGMAAIRHALPVNVHIPFGFTPREGTAVSY